MARKKKAEAHGGGVHAPPWMISWADMTTLLWACFVLLWSFSTLDLVKFQKAMSSLHGAFGVMPGGGMVLQIGEIPQRTGGEGGPADRNEMEGIRNRVRREAAEQGLEDQIQTSIDARGLTIRFDDTALFDAGSDEIKPEIVPVLNTVALELARISNPVQVEGHTDPTPINTMRFPSNWELSTARASRIVHYFIEDGGISPGRMSAAGYAFYHPVAPNDTPEGRARNRRVDVIVLNAPEENGGRSHEDALEYLESEQSTGLVMLPEDDPGEAGGQVDGTGGNPQGTQGSQEQTEEIDSSETDTSNSGAN